MVRGNNNQRPEQDDKSLSKVGWAKAKNHKSKTKINQITKNHKNHKGQKKKKICEVI